jgi:hypothetical protein
MKTITISIPKKEVKEMNAIARRSTPLPDTGECEVIKTYTADFGNGWEADIKVCNGDPPFIDPVLFENGNEVAVIEVTDTLEGEYIFDVEETFKVIIEAV